MTPAEIVATCAPSTRQKIGVLLHHLADHVSEARLANGNRLVDATDFKQWLEELAKEAERG